VFPRRPPIVQLQYSIEHTEATFPFRFLKYFFSGLVFFLLCPAINFDFTLCTATYRYVLQLEMRARLIRAIEFYLHTYLTRRRKQLGTGCSTVGHVTLTGMVYCVRDGRLACDRRVTEHQQSVQCLESRTASAARPRRSQVGPLH